MKHGTTTDAPERHASVLFKDARAPLRVKGDDRVRVVPISLLHAR